MKMTIKELAKEYYGYLERVTKEDGTSYIRCKEEAPDELRELIRKAHKGMLPDDYRYEFVAKILGRIPDWDDDIHLLVYEIEVDVNKSDLIKWFGSNSRRWEYVNEALEEIGCSDDIFAYFSNGQWLEIEEVFYSVVQSLEEICEVFTCNDN